jgi:hypothetical protein
MELMYHFLQEYEDQSTPEARFVKGMSDQLLDLTCADRACDLDLDRFEMASQGDLYIQHWIQLADGVLQRLSMNNPAELHPYNRFLIVAFHFCVTPKYNPGDGIWNWRGQRRKAQGDIGSSCGISESDLQNILQQRANC